MRDSSPYFSESRTPVEHDSMQVALELPSPKHEQQTEQPWTGGHSQGEKSDTADSVLPKVEITGAPARPHDSNWFSGALHVAEDLAVGAYKEVTQHPLQVLEAAAVGVGIGVVGTLSAPVALAVGIGGAAYAGYQLYEHGGQWLHDISIVASEDGHSQNEIAQAHQDVQGLGAGTALALAGLAGSFAGSELTGAWLAAERGAGIGLTRGEPTTPRGGYTRPAVDPFTLEKTTMSVGDSGQWSTFIDTNGKTRFGTAILNYANRWATMMEEQLAQGKVLDSALVDSTGLAADKEGVSGYMASVAHQVLVQTWKYGAQLKGIKAQY
ncbi:MAG: hypothetical protein JSS83_20065 [Cyanobacteria bacterium SZAS LIN-3]|nr:hypothetical protein [Cyanobacteria bacterium SZAS LIN-3]MBS2005559.1 hypothetical protein [Cyanobacteria bacterium SZAS TMP-1]